MDVTSRLRKSLQPAAQGRCSWWSGCTWQGWVRSEIEEETLQGRIWYARRGFGVGAKQTQTAGFSGRAGAKAPGNRRTLTLVAGYEETEAAADAVVKFATKCRDQQAAHHVGYSWRQARLGAAGSRCAKGSM
jgi:uncharacterized protein YfaP (DUF2135 family)